MSANLGEDKWLHKSIDIDDSLKIFVNTLSLTNVLRKPNHKLNLVAPYTPDTFIKQYEKAKKIMFKRICVGEDQDLAIYKGEDIEDTIKRVLCKKEREEPPSCILFDSKTDSVLRDFMNKYEGVLNNTLGLVFKSSAELYSKAGYNVHGSIPSIDIIENIKYTERSIKEGIKQLFELTTYLLDQSNRLVISYVGEENFFDILLRIFIISM